MSMFDTIGPLHDELGLKIGEWPMGATKYNGASPHPDEMRKALTKVAYRYSPLLQRMVNFAQHQGYSGEDTYVLIAFHLQLEIERQQATIMRQISCAMAPPFIVKKDGPYDADSFKK